VPVAPLGGAGAGIARPSDAPAPPGSETSQPVGEPASGAAPPPDSPGPTATIPAPDAAPPPVRLSARDRVEFHLERIRNLAAHFQRRLVEPCPRFPTPAEWDAFLDAEVGQAVLLAAHIKEAGTIARRSREEDLIRAVDVPQARGQEARGLAEKVEACARDNGATVDLMKIARRVQRELPRRRAEIRLPR
jgi:hypothetical protein